jgi:hypothetical protein
MIGTATKIALRMKGKSDPSLNTLTASSGTQPTGDVFLIMNEIVIKAVRIIVFLSNLSFYPK